MNVVNDLALTASGQKSSQWGAYARKKSGNIRNRRKCWKYGKPGHFAPDHKRDGVKKSQKAYSYSKKEDDEGINAHYATMLMAQEKCRDEVDFLIDSGASDHVVSSVDLLDGIKLISPKMIVVGNGESLTATHEGTLVLNINIGGNGSTSATRTVRF